MQIKEEYKIKYQELSLTGNIPQHPKYLYEYFLPDDFLEAKTIIYDLEITENIDFIIYLNQCNDLVLACNHTPITLGYKPQGV